MIKKLYYVVTKQLEDIDGFEEATGWKYVQVYEIENDEPKKFCLLDVANTSNSIEAIQNYLDDNGHGDETFEFIEL